MGLYIGIMSGTSLDGVDTLLCEIGDDGAPRYLHHLNTPFPAELQTTLRQLCQPGNNEIELLGRADRALATLYADSVKQLLASASLNAPQIEAIGCHGQTIRHRPPTPEQAASTAFTLQIGDPNTLAARTGICVVADFRRRDIAEGGQGAPLAPAFHRAVFASPTHDRAVINIGGMANLTLLPVNGPCTGFDTGPGNVLMDGWIKQHNGQAFDDRGLFAASGKVDAPLLDQLLSHPYFANRQGPRSTGREDFDLKQLIAIIDQTDRDIAPENVQATLLELTAQSIARPLLALSPGPNEIYVCGGGAFNTALMQRLESLLHPAQIASTASLGADPQHVEGLAFAWLAYRRLRGLSGNLPSVTGAAREVPLGAVFPP
ncbi:anhydro-N-acetylmuramic acid kinase [Litorivivens sp.]|uniref:anhydro-N-acetylmuramic acid kinase n=1 Tax=Litorivivens sp. TaxID=2020868 RepID=UPI00356ACF7D